MTRQKFEDPESHQTGGHRHDRNPASLESKVNIGGTDDGPYRKAHQDPAGREALSRRDWRCHCLQSKPSEDDWDSGQSGLMMVEAGINFEWCYGGFNARRYL